MIRFAYAPRQSESRMLFGPSFTLTSFFPSCRKRFLEGRGEIVDQILPERSMALNPPEGQMKCSGDVSAGITALH